MTDTFDALITQAATAHKLPVALVKAIIAVESDFDPHAIRQEPKLDTFSAGLMQILLTTARQMGYTGTSGEPADLSGIFDPQTNIEYGCRWLSYCLRMTGNQDGAASAYNGGYRPSLGFGAPAGRDLVVCLARDPRNGRCIQWHNVKMGAYSNEWYVTKVKANMEAA